MLGCRCSIVYAALCVCVFGAARSVSAYTLRTSLWLYEAKIAADRMYRRFFKGNKLVLLPESIFSGNLGKTLFLYVSNTQSTLYQGL